MAKKGPTRIDEVLDALRKSPETGKPFDVAKIWEQWPNVVGTKLMPYGRPVGVRDGTLVIEVMSAVWMHRYSYRKQSILRRVNQLVGSDLVREIFFVLSEENPPSTQDNV